jgi:ferredoxin
MTRIIADSGTQVNSRRAALEIPRGTVYHAALSDHSSFPVRAESRFMPKIKFIKEKKEIEVEPGANLRNVALKEGIELYPWIHKHFLFNCHGFGQCAKCCVQITKGIENVSPAGTWEKFRLQWPDALACQREGREHELRLACKSQVNGDIEVETQPPMNLHGERFWG